MSDTPRPKALADAPPGRLRVADLAQNDDNRFDLRPDAVQMRALAAQLGLIGLRKVRFAGSIRARDKRDWRLDALLGATVVQACVVTLEPVTTRIERVVKRGFLADWNEPTDEETEMNRDENTDRLGRHIDLDAVMAEALALELPDYPRKAGVDLQQATFTRPGQTPMSDEDARPFAGLAGLRGNIAKDS